MQVDAMRIGRQSPNLDVHQDAVRRLLERGPLPITAPSP